MIARNTPQPRGTLKPLWNTKPDGTITFYSRHTITIDMDTRKNTVIRKNDFAIITETKPIEPEAKPRIIRMVACKTVGKYNRNQEKIKRICLEKKAKQAKAEDQKAEPARA